MRRRPPTLHIASFSGSWALNWLTIAFEYASRTIICLLWAGIALKAPGYGADQFLWPFVAPEMLDRPMQGVARLRMRVQQVTGRSS
ncbi:MULTISPECIES: hypothetical protein [Paraburkholderia]|jgi:hypothetical protein|nr:hypothetical protein [Paraburkholderia graminis]